MNNFAKLNDSTVKVNIVFTIFWTIKVLSYPMCLVFLIYKQTGTIHQNFGEMNH